MSGAAAAWAALSVAVAWGLHTWWLSWLTRSHLRVQRHAGKALAGVGVLMAEYLLADQQLDEERRAQLRALFDDLMPYPRPRPPAPGREP